MATVNPVTKEILVKIVYYGPGLGGKTTTLEHIHKTAKPEHRGKMISLSTPVDRTLYFDFLPIRLPKIGKYIFRLQLFTVPGQVHYNATRKLVLTGADGVVMVVDSQLSRMDANIESLDNLRDNLAEQKLDLDTIPLTLQYNKRDIDNIASIEQLDKTLNHQNRFSLGTCALTGEGVYEGLQTITKTVLKDLKERQVLIHDDTMSSKQIESQIAFKKDDQGILSTVKEFSESSSTKSVPVPPEDELTATYKADFVKQKKIVPPKPSKKPAAPVKRNSAPPDNGEGAEVSITSAMPLSEVERQKSLIDDTLSFASLVAEDDQAMLVEIEEAIAAGRHVDAVEQIWKGVAHYLEVAGGGVPEKSPGDLVRLLGLDGRTYLEVARLAHPHAGKKKLPQEKVLRAYLFLLQIASSI